MVVESTLQCDRIAVGWMLCDVEPGQVSVQIMNLNDHKVVLQPQTWLVDVHVA